MLIGVMDSVGDTRGPNMGELILGLGVGFGSGDLVNPCESGSSLSSLN